MQLSPHFTLAELTASDTARREGIPNQPGPAEVARLQALCHAILEPLREAIGGAIQVNSGYRGPQLNARLRGAASSQHLAGEAADIQAPGLGVKALFKTIVRLGLPYDQVIYEAKNRTTEWVHVSHRAGGNRGQIRIAQFDAAGNATGYPPVTAAQALALPERVGRARPGAAGPRYVEGADEPVARAPRKAAATKAPAAKKTMARKTAAKKTPAPRKAPATKKAPLARKAPARP